MIKLKYMFYIAILIIAFVYSSGCLSNNQTQNYTVVTTIPPTYVSAEENMTGFMLYSSVNQTDKLAIRQEIPTSQSTTIQITEAPTPIPSIIIPPPTLISPPIP